MINTYRHNIEYYLICNIWSVALIVPFFFHTTSWEFVEVIFEVVILIEKPLMSYGNKGEKSFLTLYCLSSFFALSFLRLLLKVSSSPIFTSQWWKKCWSIENPSCVEMKIESNVKHIFITRVHEGDKNFFPPPRDIRLHLVWANHVPS